MISYKNDDEISGTDEDGGLTSPLSNQTTRPHLIVVPASVLSNWMIEFEKVCPGLVVQKYHGSMEERINLRSSLRRRPVGSPDIDVILTTFSYFGSERADDRQFLGKINFDYMIVDEAHCLKNAKGKRYQELDRMNTVHRLLLTGTVSGDVYASFVGSFFLTGLFAPSGLTDVVVFEMASKPTLLSLFRTTQENFWLSCVFSCLFFTAVETIWSMTEE